MTASRTAVTRRKWAGNVGARVERGGQEYRRANRRTLRTGNRGRSPAWSRKSATIPCLLQGGRREGRQPQQPCTGALRAPYAHIYRDPLVYSVDGDSIPIALLHHETSLGDLTTGTMRTDDLMDGPLRICIYRIATRTEEDRKQAGLDRKRAEEDKKRKHEPKAKEDARRAFEYVNIPLLHHALRDMLLQCTRQMDSPTHSWHHMSMLLGLIGLTGTDFTRGMPQVSGKTVFSFLPSIWLSLMGSYDPLSGQLDVVGHCMPPLWNTDCQTRCLQVVGLIQMFWSRRAG